MYPWDDLGQCELTLNEFRSFAAVSDSRACITPFDCGRPGEVFRHSNPSEREYSCSGVNSRPLSVMIETGVPKRQKSFSSTRHGAGVLGGNEGEFNTAGELIEYHH